MAQQLSGHPFDGNSIHARKITDCIWETCVKKMQTDLEMICFVLKTWTPEMDGSADFLKVLTANLSIEWWKNQDNYWKKEVLGELIEIDNRRGIIVDWLASVVREEQDLYLLYEIRKKWEPKWKSNGAVWPAALLEAWSSKIDDERSDLQTICLALEIVTSANLSVKESLVESEPGTWSEKERTEAVLGYLSGSGQHNCNWVVLNVIGEAMAQKHFTGEKIPVILLHKWNEIMHDTVNNTNWNEDDWMRRKAWKEMIKVASCHPGAADVIMPWMEYCLPRETKLGILNVMAEWQPAGETRQRQLMELWGHYRVSGGENHRWAAWKFGWQFLTQEINAFPGWEEIGNNCVEYLHSFLETARLFRLSPEELSGILEVIPPPRGLTAQQQTKWEALWMNLLQSSAGEVAASATTHLLRLSATGVTRHEHVKEAIFKQLITASASSVIEHILERIGVWEKNHQAMPEMFLEACLRLRQSVQWNNSQIRLATVKQLVTHMQPHWWQPEEGELSRGEPSRAVALVLDIMREESKPEIMEHTGKWVDFWWKVKSGINLLPDVFQQSVEILKKWAACDRAPIRAQAWKILHQMEDVPEAFVMECLSRERDCKVLSVMSRWNPPREKPLSSGFWKAWGKCLQEIQPSVEIIFIAQNISEICLARGFRNEQEKTGRDEKELTDMWNFWDELMTMFPDGSIRELCRGRYKILKVLAALEEPTEAFEHQMAKIERTESHVLMKSLQAVGRSEVSGESLTFNMKRNLALMAVSRLTGGDIWYNDSQDIDTWSLARVRLVSIWNHGRWDQNEMPAGWDRFREFLKKEIDAGVIVAYPGTLHRLIEAGRKVEEPRCRRSFLEMIQNMQKSTNPSIIRFGEQIFWHEVATECEKIKKDCPEGKKTDWQTEWRRLRQLVHTYPVPPVSQSSPPKIRGTGKSRKPKSFEQELWEKVELTIEWNEPEKRGQETEGKKSQKKIRLEERETFFRDLREERGRSIDSVSPGTDVKKQCHVSTQLPLPG